MKKKQIIGLIVVIILVIAGAVGYILFSGVKNQEKKVYRVGILSGLNFFADTADGFKEKMTDLGYIDGKNIIYDLQKSDFDMAAYRNIIEKFVSDKVDLIFVFPTEASQEAKIITRGTDIPVVFANAFTEDTGLVNSVQEPGENITGARWVGPDLALQRFEIMRKLVPNVTRMWIPYQRGYPIVKSQLEALRTAFAAAGLKLIELPADNAAELDAELQKQSGSFDGGKDAILIIAEPLGVTPDAFIVIAKFAIEHKIPVGGALMSIGEYDYIFGSTPQGAAQGQQAAYLADKILKGASAGTIPVVSADAYFQLNYKAAEKFGLTVPESLLERADEIIR